MTLARPRVRILRRTFSPTPRILALALALSVIDSPALLARSWSYHCTPREPQPSAAASATPEPATSRQSAAPRLFKEAIVSDLALYVQEPDNIGNQRSDEHSQYVISRLLPFDHMSAPDALTVLAGLNGYYLGLHGEQVYNCLLRRKGKQIEPYLARYVRSPNLECSLELGARFEQPSAALGGLALCPSTREQSGSLASIMYEIDLSKPCSDEELRALTQGVAPALRSGN